MKKIMLAFAIVLISINFSACTPETITDHEDSQEQGTIGEETSQPEKEVDDD
ncbi:hypothetical protein [Psychroserpens luteus]|uniref:Secreted protein n=1 Tax=Psychroserpens luteus TaxID=1434066 RepID=A0ABW5ZWL1_9FLAO|nr:hypothetical protein [Psychroserpens luteus]